MKKLSIILVLLFIPFGVAFAQTEGEDPDTGENSDIITSSSSFDDTEPGEPIKAIITSPARVQLGKNIIFDGTKSTNPTPENPLTYFWTIEKDITADTAEFVHTYNEIGTYTVSLTVSNGEETSTATREVFVYGTYMILFTDFAEEDSRITGLVNQGRDKGILIEVISDTESTNDFEATQYFGTQLNLLAKDIADAALVLFWTDGTVGLSAMADLDKTSDAANVLKDANIIYITEESLGPLSRVAQTTFGAIQPARILLMIPEARFTILEAKTTPELISILEKRDYAYKNIDAEAAQVGLLNFMSYIIFTMSDNGIPTESIVLLLMIPVIATMVAFARQIIGLTTLGLFMPVLLTLTFITLGFGAGLFIMGIVFVVGTLTRIILKRFRLLYTPRLAIILTTVTLSIIFLLYLASLTDTWTVTQASIIPIIVVITLVEDFLSLQLERGIRSSFLLILETVIVAALSFWMIEKWTAFRTFLLGYPEIIFLFIVVNILIGRYSGLRITEVFRFRSLLTHIENAEE